MHHPLFPTRWRLWFGPFARGSRWQCIRAWTIPSWFPNKGTPSPFHVWAQTVQEDSTLLLRTSWLPCAWMPWMHCASPYKEDRHRGIPAIKKGRVSPKQPFKHDYTHTLVLQSLHTTSLSIHHRPLIATPSWIKDGLSRSQRSAWGASQTKTQVTFSVAQRVGYKVLAINTQNPCTFKFLDTSHLSVSHLFIGGFGTFNQHYA